MFSNYKVQTCKDTEGEGTSGREGGTKGTGDTIETGDTRGAWRDAGTGWEDSAVMATLGDTSNGLHVPPAIDNMAFLKWTIRYGN